MKFAQSHQTSVRYLENGKSRFLLGPLEVLGYIGRTAVAFIRPLYGPYAAIIRPLGGHYTAIMRPLYGL